MASLNSNNDLGNVINFNGELIAAETPLVTAMSRGFRHGDGLFETICVTKGEIRLADLHFERLLSGMQTLLFAVPPFPSVNELSSQILDLCRHNGHLGGARVRLMVFRGVGGLYEPSGQTPQYLIQSEPWPVDGMPLNKDGWTLGIYPFGRKAFDGLSHIKSNNYLIYSMAARYAHTQGWDNCVILNSDGRVAESNIANLFYCKQGAVYTPPLTEGCIAGVMRRWVVKTALAKGIAIQEKALLPEELENAEEVFLTNALRGIVWIKRFHNTHYKHDLVNSLHLKLFQH